MKLVEQYRYVCSIIVLDKYVVTFSNRLIQFDCSCVFLFPLLSPTAFEFIYKKFKWPRMKITKCKYNFLIYSIFDQCRIIFRTIFARNARCVPSERWAQWVARQRRWTRVSKMSCSVAFERALADSDWYATSLSLLPLPFVILIFLFLQLVSVCRYRISWRFFSCTAPRSLDALEIRLATQRV